MCLRCSVTRPETTERGTTLTQQGRRDRIKSLLKQQEYRDADEADCEAADQAVARVLAAVPAQAYLNPDGFWGHPQPDRLGEYLVASALTRHPTMLAAAIHPGRRRELLARPIEVLSRASRDHQELRDAVAGIIADTLPDLGRACYDWACEPDPGMPPHSLKPSPAWSNRQVVLSWGQRPCSKHPVS